MKWLERVKGMLTTGQAGTTDPMERELARWGRLYRQGSDSGNGKLRLPAAIAGELARLTVCELEGGVTGDSERARYLDRQYRRVVARLRVWAEYGCAGGGMVLKVVPTDGELVVECVAADCFVPLAWDAAGRITTAQFGEEATVAGRRYRRVEQHRLAGGQYEITNTVTDQWGAQVAPSVVERWAELPASAVLEGIDRPLFAYYRTPMANSHDPHSPLGVSVYAGAVELIEQAEQQWERIEWEYRGGELAIDASEDLFEHRRDGSVVLPKGQERLFRAHDIDIGQSAGRFIEVFSPQLRDQSLFNGFNNILRRVEFACGLAYGTLSDLSVVERTAQEVKAGRQRSYSTVCDLQASLETALRELLAVMDIWATLLGVPSGDWGLDICWGDSVITDSDTLRSHHRADVEAGLMTREEYRDYWYAGGAVQ